MVSARGLPSGYVNKLEARLAKTEAALFHLLNQRHGGDSQPSLSDIPPAPASSVSMGQNKAERVKEWDQYPLQSMSDVQQWYRSKAIEAGHGASPPMTNRSSISQPTVIQRRKTLWGADIRPMAQNSQPSREWPRPATVTAAPDVATESPDPDSSRAKELSRSQYNMYF